MATSGTTTFNNTRNEIITGALRKCGQLAEGETATAQQVADASDDLNRLAKSLSAKGLRLWKYEEVVLFPVLTTQSYDLGPSGALACKKDDLTTTAVKAAGVATDTTIDVDSITGISDGDNIGIVIDDNTIHWTTVNGAPAGDTVTLTDALDGAAAIDNAVYVFTNKIQRPLQVTQGRVQVDANNEIELSAVGREDYFRLSNKAAAGVPVEFYYNPKLSAGKLYLYPTAQKETQYLNLTTQMPIEDFAAASNNPDLPQEWLMLLVWGLANQIYTEYGVTDPVTVSKIEKEYNYWLDVLDNFDIEEADVIFAPEVA